MTESDGIVIPISIGELIDRISILKIKLKKMNGKQLINVKRELCLLEEKVIDQNLEIDLNLYSKLAEVSLQL